MSERDLKKTIRKENLRTIIGWDSVGSATHLASIANTNSSYISQILGPSAVRSVGDSLAENIEKALSLPKGWMDVPHGDAKVGGEEVGDLLSPKDTASSTADITSAPGRTLEVSDYIPVLGTTSKGPVTTWSNPRERLTSAEQALMVQMNDPLAYALLCLQDIRQIGARAGSAVLIEPSVTPVAGDDVFILLNNGDSIICRLAGQLGGRYLISDSGEFASEEVSKSEVKYMHWIAGVMSKRVIGDRIINQDHEVSVVDDRHHAVNH